MAENFDGFTKHNYDRQIDILIEEHCEKFNISPLDAIKLFSVLGRRQFLKRFLAHADLFKKTLEVPGDIAELGVFRGSGLMTWANLLEAFCIGDRTKVVYGFENWTGFTPPSPEDGKPINYVNKEEGGFSPEKYKEELLSAIDIFDKDRFIPFKPRIKLIEGNIEQTAPDFVKENPGVRFSLIHFDCDIYKPTKAALEAFWPILSRGGIMLFDEYAIPDWAGETRAVDEFFQDKPSVTLQTFSWNNVPGAYIIK
jgi:hypothetical protein